MRESVAGCRSSQAPKRDADMQIDLTRAGVGTPIWISGGFGGSGALFVGALGVILYPKSRAGCGMEEKSLARSR